MKTHILILCSMVFVISACLSPSGGSPAQPQVTVTLPAPPTPTLHPQFIALQEQISASGGRFTLQADGMIYDGETPIPGLIVAPDGTMTLDVNGETVTLDPADVNFDDENGITIAGYEWDETANGGAGAWVEAQARLENGVGEPELREDGRYYQSNTEGTEYVLAGDEWVRTFPICDLQEGQNCNFEQLGDLSDFADFVQTQLTADMFDPAKINWVERFDALPFGAETILVPNYETAPHYTEAGSAPFIREDFTGRVMITPTEQGFVVAAPQFIPGVEPHDWPVMIGISSHEGFSKTPQAVLDTFEKDMNIMAWRVDPESMIFATQFVNPATGSNFTQSEVLAIIEEMKQGDFSHTHGLVLKIMIAKSDKGKILK